MTGGPSVSVVVCTHDGARFDLLKECVGRLSDEYSSSSITGGVIVVVDSDADLRDRCAKAFESVATVTSNSGRSGLSGARNTGLLAAEYTDVVAYVDDDAIPEPGWLASISDAFSDPSVAFVGGEVRPVWPNGGRPPWLPREFDWVVGCDYAGMPPVGARIRNPIGANMAVRRPVALRSGGFRSDLGRRGSDGAGGEETELAIRIHDTHPEAVIVRIANAAVDHHVEEKRCSIHYFRLRCRGEGRSKARLSRRGGARSLSSERRHVVSVLPRAVATNLVSSARGDRWAMMRAAATVLGLAEAARGWAGSLLSPAVRAAVRNDQISQSQPLVSVEVDPASGAARMQDSPLHGHEGVQQIRVLTRLYTRPIGISEVAVETDVRTATCAAAEEAAATALMREDQLRTAPIWRPPQPISVVVCTLGTDQRLTMTVTATLSSGSVREVIVVDNDPGSGRTAALLAQICDDRVVLVTEPRRGLSHARNTGLAHVTTPIVAFTDDDALPESDWADRLSEVFASDSGNALACVTGLVVPADFGRDEYRWFEGAAGFGRGLRPQLWTDNVRLRQRFGQCEPLTRPGQRRIGHPIGAGEFGSGNNMAFRTAALRAIGGFDPLLGAGAPTRGGEDLDVFRRVVLAGGSLFYQPAAIVRHHHRSEYRELRSQLFGYGAGMGASVLRYALSTPAALRATTHHVPEGAKLLLSPRSEKNASRPDDYPDELSWAELAGYVAAPALLARAYLRGDR